MGIPWVHLDMCWHMLNLKCPVFLFLMQWDYTARRVLTMEWIEGVKLTNKAVGGVGAGTHSLRAVLAEPMFLSMPPQARQGHESMPTCPTRLTCRLPHLHPFQPQAMEEAGLSVVDFVDVGIECTLRQLLEHGYFHADPHPGRAEPMYPSIYTPRQGLRLRGVLPFSLAHAFRAG